MFLPAGTINLSACQGVGTIRGWGQYYSAVKCMQSRVLARIFSVDLTILGHMHAVFYIQYCLPAMATAVLAESSAAASVAIPPG